jgi:tRNA(adenine34) deaminase
MKLALLEAHKSKDIDEVPVGAIIVLNGEVISRNHNKAISQNNPTAHAEINAIRNAAEYIENYRLNETSLYVTLEPCAMCYGAIIHARISRLIFGAHDYKTGVCGSSIKLHEQNCFNHTPEIKGGVLERECSLMLKEFFQKRRN